MPLVTFVLIVDGALDEALDGTFEPASDGTFEGAFGAVVRVASTLEACEVAFADARDDGLAAT